MAAKRNGIRLAAIRGRVNRMLDASGSVLVDLESTLQKMSDGIRLCAPRETIELIEDIGRVGVQISQCKVLANRLDEERMSEPFEREASMDDFKMPFGKHKGALLAEIPVEYLDWLIGQEFMEEKVQLKKRIEDHLRTRPEWQRLDED